MPTRALITRPRVGDVLYEVDNTNVGRHVMAGAPNMGNYGLEAGWG